MLRPEIIEKLRRQREEQDRPALRIPLYPPDHISSDLPIDDEEVTEASGIIVIDLA